MENLLERIRLFCEAHSMAPTRFGELALNDKPLVKRLETGRRIWPETEKKISDFMATYRPDAKSPASPSPESRAA